MQSKINLLCEKMFSLHFSVRSSHTQYIKQFLSLVQNLFSEIQIQISFSTVTHTRLTLVKYLMMTFCILQMGSFIDQWNISSRNDENYMYRISCFVVDRGWWCEIWEMSELSFFFVKWKGRDFIAKCDTTHDDIRQTSIHRELSLMKW